jgi:hypothetical protein
MIATDLLKALVVRKLRQLGNTGPRVAERLEAGGHCGVQSACGRCPVADYLLSAGLPITDVAVGDATLTVFWIQNGIEVRAEVAMPRPVRNFISGFDQGFYPALILEGVTA